MATFNSANGSFQTGNKSLFDTQMLALSNGHIVDSRNRLPVDIGNTTINISGNVNISDIVQVNSTPDNPVHNHVTEVGTSGILNVPYLPINGNVSIFNSNGTAVTNSAPLSIYVTSNVVAQINNFPVTQNVSFSNQTINISGNLTGISSNLTVSVNNFPSNVSITSGNVVLFGTSNVSFSNQSVNLVGNVAGITSNVVVQGSLIVNNFPVTQNVSFSNQSVAIYNSNNVPITNSNALSVQVVSNSTNYVYTQQAPTWSTDALGKIRISSTLNQDFFSPVVDDDTTIRWSQTISGTNANSMFLANTSEIRITSGNTAVGYVYRQTYTRYKIIPGTSHVLYTTVNWNANTTETGVTRRTGLFNTNNGIFWEQSANTLAVVVRRTLANGSMVEDRTYANSFNQDKLDGTGPSGFNMFDHGLNDYYTFWFDFIGGRTGRIRFGYGGPNGPQICHIASYSGNNANNIPFISDNSLPLRREIFNSTAQTTSPTFNMTGISYQSEAPISFNPSPTTAYNINGYVPDGTLTALLTIGLRAGAPYTGSDISPGDFSIVDINNQGKNASPATYFYQVIYNANVNGTYAYAGNGSISNTNIGRSAKMWTWANTATVTGGQVLLSGLTQSGIGQQGLNGLPGTFNLGSDINGNPATLTIAVRELAAGGATANVVATWNILEQL